MAKQNFLGGGYTGKLGATIGQRWKNAYTVRTYTKPTNPQTPAQQANRGAFGGAVFFAQLGNQMNYKSPAFDTANNTEWAYRMSAAKINIQNSLTDLAIIPIVPQNFTTSPTVSGISLKNIVANTSIEFELTLSSGVGAKSYSLMLYFAEGSREGEYLLLRGSTTAAEPTKLICPCANTATIGQVEVYALIVSTDDTVAETIAYSARVPLVNASKPAFAQTVSITSVTSDNAGGFVVAAQMGVYGADLVGNFTNGGILSKGNYKTKAAVQTAGGESGASSTTALGLSWNVSNWNVNNITGVITFTARPTNYQEINHYELTEFRLALAWENAYNSQTEMSSGSCQAAFTTLPTYTQPAFSTAHTTVEATCQGQMGLGEVEVSMEYKFTDTDFAAALRSWFYSVSRDPNQKGTISGTCTAEDDEGALHSGALQYMSDASWSIAAGPDYWVEDMINTESPTLSDWDDLTVVNMNITASSWDLFLDGTNTPLGVYDNNHRWTKYPTMSYSGIPN